MRPPVETGHPRLALVGLDPAPTNRDRETREPSSNILQVIKGFGLDRKVSTVAGSSQGGVAVEGNGDGAHVTPNL